VCVYECVCVENMYEQSKLYKTQNTAVHAHSEPRALPADSSVRFSANKHAVNKRNA
jgi:hypothetical protein